MIQDYVIFPFYMLAMQSFLKFALQGFFELFGGMLRSWIASGSLTADLNSMSTVEDESIEYVYFVVYYLFALTPKIFSPASILRSWEDENYVEVSIASNFLTIHRSRNY